MLNLLENPCIVRYHTYLLSVSGIDMRKTSFECSSRVEAEIMMHKLCSKYNVGRIECTEFDKHERKYSNHNGVRFYINRI